MNFYTGRILDKVLKNNNEKISVLEIGSGHGFHTRQIVEDKNVKEYVAVEIVQDLLDYLKDNIETDKKLGFICGSITKIEKGKKYDLIIFLSSFHHMADRESFMASLLELCNKETTILFVEPTHYLWKILKLLTRIPSFVKRQWVEHDDYIHMYTHGYLTLAEFKCFKKYQIKEYSFQYPRKLKFLENKIYWFSKYFSHRMYILLKPTCLG